MPAMHAYAGRVPHHRMRTTILVAVVIALVLVVLRAIAPFVVRRVVNDRLAGLPGYVASIGDVDLSLWRGAYQIENLDIQKVEGRSQLPFVHIDVIDLAIEW